jgi:hypothetical protein
MPKTSVESLEEMAPNLTKAETVSADIILKITLKHVAAGKSLVEILCLNS